MLIVERDGANVPPRFLLKGVIDENTDFKAVFAGIGNSANLYCKDVSRINSLGVKGWNDFFANYRNGGGVPSFFEMSPALVASMNTVIGFVKKSEVVSICAPFMCDSCEKESSKVIAVTDVPAFIKSDLKMPCPHCGQTAEFDDLPQTYFACVLR